VPLSHFLVNISAYRFMPSLFFFLPIPFSFRLVLEVLVSCFAFHERTPHIFTSRIYIYNIYHCQELISYYLDIPMGGGGKRLET